MPIHDEHGRAAALMARAAVLNAEVSGMNAENAVKISNGESPIFGIDHFKDAIDQSGCHENGIIELLIHGNL